VAKCGAAYVPTQNADIYIVTEGTTANITCFHLHDKVRGNPGKMEEGEGKVIRIKP
jgi:hypothetical protein